MKVNYSSKRYVLILGDFFLIDIDECEDPHACGEHQICNNTNGSYTVSLFEFIEKESFFFVYKFYILKCVCESGYEMNITANGSICQGKDQISS